MAMVNPTAHPNSVVEVARRLSIMYAKEIRVETSTQNFRGVTQIAIKGKSGEYEPSTVLQFECGGLLYYCSSISVHPFGIKLHHVWGIFPA